MRAALRLAGLFRTSNKAVQVLKSIHDRLEGLVVYEVWLPKRLQAARANRVGVRFLGRQETINTAPAQKCGRRGGGIHNASVLEFPFLNLRE